MGINKREQEALEQKAKTQKIIIIVAVVVAIIALIVISIVLNNRDTEKIEGTDNNSNNNNSSNNYNLTASEKKLEKEILEADKPVLVDYYADWCGPCVAMAPIMEELKNEQDDFYVMKVDTEENQNLWIKANSRYIPYFVLYNNGEVVASTTGMQSKESILNFVNSNIQK